MFAHRLPEAGRFMLGYRYMDMRQSGPLQAGGTTLAAADAQAGCGSVDCASRMTSMTMRMHMLELMVAPTSWLSLMLMPQIIDGEMDMSPLPGALTTTHLGEHVSDGLGDTLLAAVLRVFERPGQQINLSLGFSAPTGESAATLDGAATPDSIPLDYGMQRGSGTWDARPVLSYLGEQGPWFWGAQLGGTFRLAARNDAGYAPGDNWQLSGWGGRRLTPWLASSLRIVQTSQASVRGAVRRASLPESAGEFPGNQGGRYTDLGIGINASLPGSAFAGHALALEWLQPIADHVNGVQLERSGALMANWSFAF